MNVHHQLSRREMLSRCSTGFGALALAGLGGSTSASTKQPHFQPRAKHVIFCYMAGGVSQLDSFDPKPRLLREHGKPMPVKIERTQFNKNGNIFGSPFSFRRYGESGIPVSSLFPHIARHVDDLAVIRSMTSPVNEHATGAYFFHTGFPTLGHPSAGAWASYGLGSMNETLPAFVVLQKAGTEELIGGLGVFGNGYLPAQHQASVFNPDEEEVVRNLNRLESLQNQRHRLDFVGQFDRQFLQASGGDANIEAAIQNYETAFRMQTAVPELCDLSGETPSTKRLYGLEHPNQHTRDYGRQCLLARRLVERGVRFIELSCMGDLWDQHANLVGGHKSMAMQVDQPIAGLISDLKSRGLLDETLVIFASEFGRTPFSQGTDGRDHNPFGFSIWMAGGGIKGGSIHGATDEYGYHVVEDRCTVYDVWATTLHLLGMDHERLTFRYGGRDLRLTDVHGDVIHPVIT